MQYDIKDIRLAKAGTLRIEWAAMSMPVLKRIEERFKIEKPFKGIKIAACLHVTTETASLMKTLKTGGAEVYLCASNPLSTQDDVAASLVKNDKISVFAVKGESNKEYYQHLTATLENSPNYTMDDGADLVSLLHTKQKKKLSFVLGGTEETTTGVIRLKSMAKHKILQYPIIAVNNAKTKHFFDNRYGTGQSTLDGIVRATNRLVAGSTFVVCGYGWCGKGLAMRARGMGAKVIVTEVDSTTALEAVMDGFEVMPIAQSAKVGDFFCTVTGNINVIRKEHFLQMKDGAIISNSGHFNVELQMSSFDQIATKKREIRPFVMEYTLKNKKRLYVLAEGRLINLAAAEGHPSSVMDMSFSNQALCLEYLVNNRKNLKKEVYSVPEKIDQAIAAEKLASMDIKIDTLTSEQKKYLSSWTQGT